MENRNLMLDVVEKWGEDSQMDMIAEKSLLMTMAIQKLRKTDRREDRRAYNEAYNNVCERVADMRLMIEEAEFLFNKIEIDNHYINKVQLLKQALNEF